jgi:rod shape determining protein RodA
MNQRLMEFLKRYDFSFIGSMSAIFLVGILNLYSATHSQSHEGLDSLYKSQLMWFGIAVSVAIGISFLNSKTFERFSYVGYLLTLFLVFLVQIVAVRIQVFLLVAK